MPDDLQNLPSERNAGGESIWTKMFRDAIELIGFIAGNTDREFAGKLFAVVIAFGYLVAVVVITKAITPIVPVTVALLVPLGLIWFPEEVGGFTGYVSRGGNIDTETPPSLVSLIGWLILVGPPIFAFCSWLAG